MEYLVLEKNKSGLLYNYEKVNLIPLDKVKQAKEEMEIASYSESIDDVLAILDKLIAESEGEKEND